MEEALRYNKDKPQWSLVDFSALSPLVRVLMYGAKKYTTDTRSGKHQWRDGLKTTEICESLMRHLVAYMEGEDDDQESKESHIGHIMANAMFLSYQSLYNRSMDDRFIDKNKSNVTSTTEG